MDWEAIRTKELEDLLDHLISSPKHPFDGHLRSLLPDLPGLYVISVKGNEEGEYLRAGRTDEGGLRQRVYGNHLMGDQKGNLRQQLTAKGICNDLESAKKWMQENCQVQWVVIHDPALRKWAEHYVLSVLRPQLCD